MTPQPGGSIQCPYCGKPTRPTAIICDDCNTRKGGSDPLVPWWIVGVMIVLLIATIALSYRAWSR